MNKNLKTKNLNNPLAYFRPSVATDGVVFKVQNNELYILLVKRGISETGTTKEFRPYMDYWALPGGFIRGKESAEEAVIRELKEETNLNLKISKNKTSIYQTGFYSTPDRIHGHLTELKEHETNNVYSICNYYSNKSHPHCFN